MSIQPVTKREKELYPLVTRLLAEQGLRVWEEVTIRAGDEGTRTADHVAWRWNGAEIEARAVEVKVGSADIAFAQAVAYEVGFPRVYVAADEALAETGYLGRVFDRVGLGYIRVGVNDATIELEPKDSLFLSASVHDENLARIRLKHLFTDELIGEPIRFSKDRRGDIWGVTGTTREWQVCGQVVAGSACTWLSLLAEGKGIGVRAAAMKPDRLAAAIDPLPGSRLVLRRREHKGYRPVHEELAIWRPSDGGRALDQLLRDARALAGQRNIGPQFQVLMDFWPHDVRISEEDARRQLAESVTRLRTVRDELNT
jgi:hypothetical protein